MTQYKTIKAKSVHKLMVEIKKSIKSGWTIWGGGLTRGLLKPTYSQDMIKN